MNAIASTHTPSPHKLTEKASRRILYETLIVLSFAVIPSLLWPNLKGLLAFLPIVYLLVERWLRKRPWAELGFNIRGFKQSLVANWYFILLVAIVIPLLVTWSAKAFWPAMLTHIQSRIPLFSTANLDKLLLLLVIATLGEEMAYRSLFQERLSWFIPTPLAIMIGAIVFGVMHRAKGDPLIVTADVLLVMVDGVIYGVIFNRGKNIYVAWLAHFLADTFALAFMLWL